MRYLTKTLLSFAVVFVLPVSVQASQLRIVASEDTLKQSDTFEANIFLDTKSEYINAIDGFLVVPSGLTVREIRFDSSVVPLWVEAPKAVAGGVSFAGVMPGGYKGSPEIQENSHGNLFVVVLEAQRAGSYTLSFRSGTSVYIDDGFGTKDSTSFVSSKVSVASSVGGEAHVTLAEDTLPPEPFMLSLSSGEPYGIEGEVIVFSTQDKNTGVDHFEVAQSYNKFARRGLSWSTTTSPYALSGMDEGTYIFVKAVDGNGNFEVARLAPRSYSFYAFVYTWGLYVGAGLVVLTAFVIHFIRRKRR